MIDNEPGTNMNTTSYAEMMAYDQLPVPLRKALRDAPFDFSSETTLHWYRTALPEYGSDALLMSLDGLRRDVRQQRTIEIREGRLPVLT